MKRRRMLAGVAAVVGSGALLLTGSLPSTASANTVSQQRTVQAAQAGNITFVPRYFDCYVEYGCHGSAQVPKTWKHIVLGRSQDKFKDPARDRMIRFDLRGSHVSTATAIKQKKAALRGTRGLHVVGTSTVTMKSNSLGHLTVSTIVYTYRRGNTTRWVATRYLGRDGWTWIEITVAGASKDRKVLGTVINRATRTLTLAG